MSDPRYILVTTPRARKILRKLPLPVRKHLVDALEILETDPFSGSPLKGHSGLCSLHTRYKGTDYRVIYEVHPEEKKITIRFAGSRENFYKEFSHYVRKRILR